ncbi:unnamed protein product, partial [Candida parapsilosis]
MIRESPNSIDKMYAKENQQYKVSISDI